MSIHSRMFLWFAGGLLFLIGSPQADVVTRWNILLCDALRSENSGPTAGSRNAAIVHAAIHDAVNSVLQTHEPYRFSLPAAVGALPEAAALAAGHLTLSTLCPSKRGAFDAAYWEMLATLPPGTNRDEGLRLGQTIATLMLESRNADGINTQVPYIPGEAPGAWRRTWPDFRPPLDPHWGFVQPFVIPATAHFPVPPPPALDSPAYASAFMEVNDHGARVSASRTPDQTEIGVFWAYDRGGMGPPPILYNQLVRVIAAQQGNTLADNARLFALINIAQADAGIVCWAAKYQYNFWRPITAVRAASLDGNPATTEDSGWEPLGAPGQPVRPDFTPPFPSYPSGHASFGAAVIRVLQRFYGRDNLAFTLTSDELPSAPRQFQSLSQADEENALSRVYLGVHWIFDQRAGQQSGWAVGDYVFFNTLRPLTAEPRLSAPLRLPDGQHALHLSVPADQSWIIKASGDLRSWSEIQRQTGPFTFLDAAGEGARFYLAVPAP